MLKLAVFGDPVSHSLSPRIHSAFAAQCDVVVDYQAQQVSAAELGQALAAFAAAGGAGVNLTVPHKHAGLGHCYALSERARTAAAVNTLRRDEQGWYGDNTDGAGLVWDLQENLGWPLAQRPLVIIGAGGAAAGILPALLGRTQAPAWSAVVIANRSPDKARQWLSQYHDATYSPTPRVCALSELVIPADALLINATSCGHQGICPELPEPAVGCAAYDLNYGAAARPFLNWAQQHDMALSDGLGMLVGQAAEAFTMWTGQRPQAQRVLEKLRPAVIGESR